MSIQTFLNKDFDLLDDKKNRLFLVLFLLVYIILFLNIFVPFDIDKWAPNSFGSKFLSLSGFAVVGAAGIAFSQFVLRKWFHREHFLIKQFIVWVIFELFFLTILLVILYDNVSDSNSFIREFQFNLKHTFLIAVIPYSIVLLILSLFQSKSELVELKKESKKVVLSNELIKFPDDKGNLKFTMPLRDLLYLESTDNYVYIYHISHDKLKKELLRNSLKNLENIFKNTSIIRCHRSYMVNLENLNLVKKTGQKMLVKLNQVEDLIPVSKTYQEGFKEFLQLD
jgi:hypothetical protein